MRVMGVDPGLTRCGLSIVESGRGRNVVALDVDVVRTPSDAPLSQRLLAIHDVVEHWLDTHVPDVMAIERVFSRLNVTTVMGTAQAGGVIALAAARRGLDNDTRARVSGDRERPTGKRSRGTFPQVILHPPPWKSRGEVAAKGCEGFRAFLTQPCSRAQGRKNSIGEREREEGTPETFRTSVSNSGEASIRAEMFSPRWCRLLTPVLKSLGCGFSAKDILASNPPPTPPPKVASVSHLYFPQNLPYCSISEPTAMAWRDGCEQVSRVFDAALLSRVGKKTFARRERRGWGGHPGCRETPRYCKTANESLAWRITLLFKGFTARKDG